jgi:hypothetical protein
MHEALKRYYIEMRCICSIFSFCLCNFFLQFIRIRTFINNFLFIYRHNLYYVALVFLEQIVLLHPHSQVRIFCKVFKFFCSFLIKIELLILGVDCCIYFKVSFFYDTSAVIIFFNSSFHWFESFSFYCIFLVSNLTQIYFQPWASNNWSKSSACDSGADWTARPDMLSTLGFPSSGSNYLLSEWGCLVFQAPVLSLGCSLKLLPCTLWVFTLFGFRPLSPPDLLIPLFLLVHLNFSTFFPVMENSQAGHVLVFGWRIYFIRFVLIRQTDTQPGHAHKTDILEFELIQTLYKS